MAFFDYNISVTGDCLNTSSGAITLQLTGGTPPYTVEWISPYVGSFIDILDPVTITGLYSDTYVVRVNDSTLPENLEFFINIPVSNGVCGSIVEVQDTTCDQDNGYVIATSTSNYSSTNYYLYNGSNVFITSAVTNTSEVLFDNLSADTYYLIVQDLGGCTAKTQDFIIQESTPLDFGFYVVPNASCGLTALGKLYVTGITGTPPYTYLWSNSLTGSSITGLTSGVYSVKVTDALGCELTKTETITDIGPVGFGSFTATTPSCLTNDGVLTLTITGGSEPYYYSASTGDFLISYSKSYTLTGLTAGNYIFKVTDAALCSFEASTFLASAQGIDSVTISSTNSSCSSDDGTISITLVGGTAPYNYTLIYPDSSTETVTSYSLNKTFTNLSGGTYTVFVQDSNGCSYSEEVYLITNNKFTFTAQTTGTTCNVYNGTIQINVGTGYTLPLTYSLDGVQYYVNTNLSAVTFTNVSSGQHAVKVTDSTGCYQLQQVLVQASSSLVFSLFSTPCGDGSSGTITALISSGNAPYTFDWSDNIAGNPQQIQVTGLTAGTYSLTIIDSSGCTLTSSATIQCNQLYSTYQVYVMGGEEFQIESLIEAGLLQMLNEGFYDLTIGNSGCSLLTANFNLKVSINPLGLTSTNSFYTSTSLLDVPSNEEYFTVLQNLLLSVPGVGFVNLDTNTNQIKVQTIPGNTTLNGQQILVELIIIYDINCTA
jgi:uncharacterized protein (DUF2141 family)